MAETGILRVGILWGGTTPVRWQADTIRQVLELPGVVPVLVVETGTSGDIHNRPFSKALYSHYMKKYFKPPSMDRVDPSDLLGGLPRLTCTTEKRGTVDHFRPKDLADIAARRPDVLLCFGDNILGGDILTLPRHGAWGFHHGDPARFRGGPTGFWEIIQGEALTGAALLRLNGAVDSGHVLRQGWFPTSPSLEETVDTVLGHTTGWPAQVMGELLAGVPGAAEGRPVERPGPLHHDPGNTDFLRYLWKRAFSKPRARRDREEWNIGMLYQPVTDLLDEDASLNVRWLPPPRKGTSRTHPFGYHTSEGQLNVLYEKSGEAGDRGVIARLRPKKDNILKRSRTMLSGDTHLSHPYVVERGGTVYVVPENADAGRVDLYRVNPTNDGLERVGTLLNEALLNPTLFQHEGRWWLLGTKPPLDNTALHAYWSERFEGPYVPHALNPVKMDTRSARPAGTPFRHGSELWRPAQDRSQAHGGRVALNRVTELTPERFQEDTVKYVGPMEGTPYPDGMRTLSTMGNITLIDGRRAVTAPERTEKARHKGPDQRKRRTHE